MNKLVLLQELNLSGNRITEIKGLGDLERLKSLNLAENPIKKEELSLINEPAQKIVEFCKKKRIFIFMVMPFKPELTNIYIKNIQNPIEKLGHDVVRADDFFKSEPILDEILKYINNADLIIADLTDKNPNVFYEIGRAHELKKTVLQISQKIEDIPFDLRHRRTIQYENTYAGLNKLTEQIINYILNEFKKEDKKEDQKASN